MKKLLCSFALSFLAVGVFAEGFRYPVLFSNQKLLILLRLLVLGRE